MGAPRRLRCMMNNCGGANRWQFCLGGAGKSHQQASGRLNSLFSILGLGCLKESSLLALATASKTLSRDSPPPSPSLSSRCSSQCCTLCQSFPPPRRFCAKTLPLAHTHFLHGSFLLSS